MHKIFVIKSFNKAGSRSTKNAAKKKQKDGFSNDLEEIKEENEELRFIKKKEETKNGSNEIYFRNYPRMIEIILQTLAFIELSKDEYQKNIAAEIHMD